MRWHLAFPSLRVLGAFLCAWVGIFPDTPSGILAGCVLGGLLGAYETYRLRRNIAAKAPVFSGGLPWGWHLLAIIVGLVIFIAPDDFEAPMWIVSPLVVALGVSGIVSIAWLLRYERQHGTVGS